MSEFFVGQRIQCVKDCHDHHGYGDENFPEVGRAYTVREMLNIEPDNRPLLLVEEVKNSVRPYWFHNRSITIEPPWFAEYFAPFEFKSEEIFRRIAHDVTQGKEVEIA